MLWHVNPKSLIKLQISSKSNTMYWMPISLIVGLSFPSITHIGFFIGVCQILHWIHFLFLDFVVSIYRVECKVIENDYHLTLHHKYVWHVCSSLHYDDLVLKNHKYHCYELFCHELDEWPWTLAIFISRRKLCIKDLIKGNCTRKEIEKVQICFKVNLWS